MITASSSWIRKLFPHLGGFLFWALWPYVVARMTKTRYYRYTGQTMPVEQFTQLRKDLARITRPIVKPDSNHESKTTR